MECKLSGNKGAFFWCKPFNDSADLRIFGAPEGWSGHCQRAHCLTAPSLRPNFGQHIDIPLPPGTRNPALLVRVWGVNPWGLFQSMEVVVFLMLSLKATLNWVPSKKRHAILHHMVFLEHPRPGPKFGPHGVLCKLEPIWVMFMGPPPPKCGFTCCLFCGFPGFSAHEPLQRHSNVLTSGHIEVPAH